MIDSIQMRKVKDYDNKVNVLSDFLRLWWVIRNLDQIAYMLWYANRSSAKIFLKKLCEKGLLERDGFSYRPTKSILGLPLFEHVRAWLPFTPQDDLQSNIDINWYLVPHPNSTYLVKIKGDSMILDWIMEWDIAVVDRSVNPTNGNIVIASLWWDVTIKRLEKNNGKTRLLPANPAYSPIEMTEDSEILWVVVSVIRKYI